MRGLYRIESLYRKESGARNLLEREKKNIFVGQDIVGDGDGGMARVFITQIASSSTRAMERVNVTDHLIEADQKILRLVD